MSTTLTFDDADFPEQPARAAVSGLMAHGAEFLAFRLGGEEYGLDIGRVQEVLSFTAPARVADQPAGVLGVLHHRGVAMPVVDLRLRLGLPQCRYDANTVTLLVAAAGRVVGIVVDGVCDVVAVAPAQLQPAPDLHTGPGCRHVFAVGALERRTLQLVDLDGLLADPALGLIGP